ncbi:hypothetical protein ACFV0H_38920, partial [Streptomyces erythrochromogenes]
MCYPTPQELGLAARALADEHPGEVRLRQAGTSRAGQPIWVLSVAATAGPGTVGPGGAVGPGGTNSPVGTDSPARLVCAGDPGGTGGTGGTGGANSPGGPGGAVGAGGAG